MGHHIGVSTAASRAQQEPFVLLVEDNVDDERLTLRGINKCSEGVSTEVCRDGEEAIAFLRRVDEEGIVPVLVLLDLKLPKVSGFEVLEAYRNHEKMKSVPVVVLTSSDEAADVARANELGADDYMLKPIEFEGYMNAMQSICKLWLPRPAAT